MLKVFDHPVEIKRSQRRTTTIKVEDGKVLVYTNQAVSQEEIAALLKKYEKRIAKLLEQSGPDFRLLGKKYQVTVVCGSRYGYQFQDDNLVLYLRDKQDSPMIYDAIYVDHQAVLREIAEKCVAIFPVKPQRVQIKRMKRSFGICHSNKEISLSLFVLKYSKEFIEMVIYHELCHLVYMDHSAAFYRLLSEYCPQHRRIKKEAGY